MMSTVLRAQGVTKIYKNAAYPSLDDVSFQVPEGEWVSIMGASGSGKTTLLGVLSTMDAPTGGDVFIRDVNVKRLSGDSAADFRRDHVGFIFQEYFLLDSLTIRENISVPLTLKRLPPREIEGRVKNLAERFGIASQLDKYPRELSGGQRQRASAARAIVKQPDILFADEPTGALDSASATELLACLQEAHEALHTTLLMVTHDAYAASFADRMLLFRDGRLVGELARSGRDRRAFYEAIAGEAARLDAKR